MHMRSIILLVDSNQTERERLAAMLRKEIGGVVLEANNATEAFDILEKEDVGLVIADVFLPQKNDGITFFKTVHKKTPHIVTMASVPFMEREIISEVLKIGVFFYINKPYDFNEAVIASSKGLNHFELSVHHERRGPKIRKTEGFHGIIGNSPKMQKLFRLIEKIADDNFSTVLIQGESGTGKELVARAIHAQSPRHGKNFVPFNCAAIPDELLESELFGYVKGAFTGAAQSKMGRLQYADGGTLFLDEIGDMKPALQAKLLRVLQEKEFEPVGGLKSIPVDVRIVAATHRDLEDAVKVGTFREDLYYRLSVVPIYLPPLRDRKDDIPSLVEKFVQVFNRNKKVGLSGFDDKAMECMINYPWPGNVRELENLIQRMVILHSGEIVSLDDLPPKYVYPEKTDIPAHEEGRSSTAPSNEDAVLWNPDGVDFNMLVSDFEDRLIMQALAQTGGNKKEAARLLNLKRTTLIEKVKKKQLEVPLD